jgi:hypothetical protein
MVAIAPRLYEIQFEIRDFDMRILSGRNNAVTPFSLAAGDRLRRQQFGPPRSVQLDAVANAAVTPLCAL